MQIGQCESDSKRLLVNVEQIIYQSQNRGCGYTCVKMLLAHVYKRKEFAYLSEPPCYGVAPSLKEVIAYAGKHGLTLRGYKVSEKSRFTLPKKKPVLALIEEDGLSHLVYLRLKGNSYWILDPARGKRKLKHDEFASLFQGIYLEVESVAQNEESIELPSYLNKRRSFLTTLLRVIALIAMFVAFYFVDDQGSYLFALIAFVFFCSFTVLERIYLSRSLRAFDGLYLGSVTSLPLEERRDAYFHYLRFKAAIFTRVPSLCSGALMIVALGILFWLNEEWMGVATLSLFVLLTLAEVVMGPWFKKRGEELEKEEEAFLGGYSYGRRDATSSKRMIRLTYRLADLTVYRGYFFFLVELLLALGVTFLSGPISLNAFFLWLMALWLLGDEYAKWIKTLREKDSLKREEAYFLGHFYSKK